MEPENKPKHKITRREFVATSAALPLVGFQSGNAQLLDRSTKLAMIGDEMAATYFWQSRDTLLVLRRLPDNEYYSAGCIVLEDQGKAHWRDLPPLNSLRFDRPQVKVQYAASSAAYRSDSEIILLPPVCTLSPNGRWLLWRGHESLWHLTDVMGACGTESTTPVTDGTTRCPVWFAQDQTWVELKRAYTGIRYRLTQALIHPVSNPANLRKVDLHDVPDGFPVGITSDSRMLICCRSTAQHHDEVERHATRIHEVSLTGKSPIGRSLGVAFPAGTRVMEAILSPQGQTIAWLLCGTNPLTNRRYFCLMTSDVDGSHRREMGQVELNIDNATAGPARSRAALVKAIRWSPDGQYMSFLYDDAIYITDMVRTT